jgi:hypothetical protein
LPQAGGIVASLSGILKDPLPKFFGGAAVFLDVPARSGNRAADQRESRFDSIE